MDPVAFAVGGFPNEFVEMGVVHEPAELFATYFIAGEMKVRLLVFIAKIQLI